MRRWNLLLAGLFIRGGAANKQGKQENGSDQVHPKIFTKLKLKLNLNSKNS